MYPPPSCYANVEKLTGTGLQGYTKHECTLYIIYALPVKFDSASLNHQDSFTREHRNSQGFMHFSSHGCIRRGWGNSQQTIESIKSCTAVFKILASPRYHQQPTRICDIFDRARHTGPRDTVPLARPLLPPVTLAVLKVAFADKN